METGGSFVRMHGREGFVPACRTTVGYARSAASPLRHGGKFTPGRQYPIYIIVTLKSLMKRRDLG